MPKTRSLKDLYVVGKEVTIADGKGGVTVWLQKLNPVDHDTALRKANAKRGATLAMSRLPEDSEERQAYMNQLFDIAQDKEDVITIIVQEKMSERHPVIEAEVADKEEWSKDDYIQGLRDSWNDTYFDVFAKATTDEAREEDIYKQAERVSLELERFIAEVNEEVNAEAEGIRKELRTQSDEKLINDAVNLLIESQANLNWLIEFRKCEVWLGTRDGETKEHYFEKREDVDELSTEVLNELMSVYANLNVDLVEGKD